MESLKLFLVLIFANILFGTTYPYQKEILASIGPKEWVFLRVSLTFLILLISQYKKISFKNIPQLGWLLIASFLGIIVNQIGLAEGLSRTTVGNSAMINATIPLQALLLGWLFAEEDLSKSKVIGILLGFIGIFFLFRGDAYNLFHHLETFRSANFLQGDLLCLLNAASYALYLVVVRSTLSNEEPLTTFLWMNLFGVIGTGFYAHWHLPLTQVMHAPLHLQLTILYVVLGPTLLAYALILWTLKKSEASEVALFVYVQPVVAIIFAYFMNGERPTVSFYESAACVLVGLVIYHVKD